jgi:hypothetical protein
MQTVVIQLFIIFLLEEQGDNMPDTYLKTSTSDVYILNGIDDVICWDGLKSQAVLAKVEFPTLRPVLSSSGAGGIAGKYYSYVRFIDVDGTPSNLSPLSSPVTVNASFGSVVDVSSTTPIVVESVGHKLATGQFVALIGVGGITEANGTFKIEVIDADFFILLETQTNSGNTYTGGGTWNAGVKTINYTDVQVPTDSRIVKRQILRNTNGQTEVFFVDVETSDITSTVFSSILDDEALSNNEDVPLYNSENKQIANSFAEIPNWKPCAATVSDRSFYGGSISYTDGSAKILNGSSLVYGIGTKWKKTFVGRRFLTPNSINFSIIKSVDIENQTLTLNAPFSGVSGPYSNYSIAPPYLEKKALYYSEIGQPKNIKTTSGLVLQEEQDEIIALLNLDTYLLIFCKSKLFRLTFGSSPDTDGSIYPASYTRGALNQKCIVTMGAAAVAMDRLGVYTYLEGKEEAISLQINSLFEGSNKNYDINWKYSRFFHAVHISSKSTIRWFVVMGAGRYPRHALCYNYQTNAWWIEEFSVPIMSSCQDFEVSASTCFLGTNNNRVLRYPSGNLDGHDQSLGKVNGSITSSQSMWIEDSSFNFDLVQAVNNPVTIFTQDGTSYNRVIKKTSGTRAYLDRPLIVKISGATYTLGSSPWLFKTGTFRIEGNDKNIVRNMEINYQPTSLPSFFNLKFYRDRLNETLVFKKPYRKQTEQEFYVSDDGKKLIGNFINDLGALQQRFDTHKESSVDGVKYIALELNGNTTESEEIIYGIRLEGVFHAPSEIQKE